MTRIVHLALKVEDLEKTTEFYQKVFGFWEAETRKTRDHLSRHLTDGDIDFTLGKNLGIVAIAPLGEDGRFVEGFGPFTGMEAIDRGHKSPDLSAARATNSSPSPASSARVGSSAASRRYASDATSRSPV